MKGIIEGRKGEGGGGGNNGPGRRVRENMVDIELELVIKCTSLFSLKTRIL